MALVWGVKDKVKGGLASGANRTTDAMILVAV